MDYHYSHMFFDLAIQVTKYVVLALILLYIMKINAKMDKLIDKK